MSPRKKSKKNPKKPAAPTGSAALNVVAAHQESEEIDRLREENRKLREALNVIQEHSGDKADYYDRLVWYARSNLEDSEKLDMITKGWKGDEKKVEQFLKDAEDLHSVDTVDWHHGFNSRCLAMARLFLQLSVTEDEEFDEGGKVFRYTVEQQREEALNEFPSLDT